MVVFFCIQSSVSAYFLSVVLGREQLVAHIYTEPCDFFRPKEAVRLFLIFSNAWLASFSPTMGNYRQWS